MPPKRSRNERSRYQLTVEVPIGDSGWHAAGTFIDHGGRLVLAALVVLPGSDRSGRRAGEWEPAYDPLTKTLLGELPLAELAALANQTYAYRRGAETNLRLRPGLRSATVHPGKATPDRDYLRYAVRFAELIANGERHYREQMAQEFELTPEQVRERIRECRKRELLTPATSGRATGTLTPKAQQLLETA
jgi:hypothetical protein